MNKALSCLTKAQCHCPACGTEPPQLCQPGAFSSFSTLDFHGISAFPQGLSLFCHQNLHSLKKKKKKKDDGLQTPPEIKPKKSLILLISLMSISLYCEFLWNDSVAHWEGWGTSSLAWLIPGTSKVAQKQIKKIKSIPTPGHIPPSQKNQAGSTTRPAPPQRWFPANKISFLLRSLFFFFLIFLARVEPGTISRATLVPADSSAPAWCQKQTHRAKFCSQGQLGASATGTGCP